MDDSSDQSTRAAAAARVERARTLKGAAPEASARTWRQELRDALRSVDELWRRLALPGELLPGARTAAGDFPLLVPPAYLARIRVGDVDDPLLRQVLPQGAELRSVPGYGVDPVGESACHAAPGLLRKYRGRALLVTTGACAVHCRYCFRRHFPYDSRPSGSTWFEPAVAAIAEDDSVDEILLSGGDPLTLADHQLAPLIAALAAVPHLKRLRIHTRLPVMIPQRITEDLVAILRGSRLDPVLVLHANHGNEIDDAVAKAVRRCTGAGIPVLNQAVLLRGVNDTVVAQLSLGERLIAAGVVPYYCHQLDPVAGAAHFAVPDDEAQALWDALHARAAGYLVPRLVREVPAEVGKSWLWPRGHS